MYEQPNYHPTGQTIIFYVDTTAPKVSNLSVNNTDSGDRLLSFTVDTETSWVGYSLDNQANVTINSEAVLKDLTVGSHNVTVYAEDKAGNMATSETICFTIERPPIISGLSVENKTYNQLDLPLDFTVNEPASWMGYSLDNEANVTLTGNTTLTLKEGIHSITVYANDIAGNMATSETIYFTIEQVFPTIPVTAAVVTTASVGLGLLVYFKKRKH